MTLASMSNLKGRSCPLTLTVVFQDVLDFPSVTAVRWDVSYDVSQGAAPAAVTSVTAFENHRKL